MTFIYLLLSTALSANLGHRACGGSGGYYKKLPENTIASLRACLEGVDGFVLQDEKGFEYLEFDVQETYDNQLVLFHDSHLGRNFKRKENEMAIQAIEEAVYLRKGGARRTAFSRLTIKDLTLEELKSLNVVGQGAEQVPSLEEFFSAVVKYNLRKPLILEVKKIYSDTAWQKLVNMMSDMKVNYMDQKEITVEDGFDFPSIISFLGFKSSVKKSFGKFGNEMHRYWCDEIKKAGLEGIFRPISHSKNYCDI